MNRVKWLLLSCSMLSSCGFGNSGYQTHYNVDISMYKENISVKYDFVYENRTLVDYKEIVITPSDNFTYIPKGNHFLYDKEGQEVSNIFYILDDGYKYVGVL